MARSRLSVWDLHNKDKVKWTTKKTCRGHEVSQCYITVHEFTKQELNGTP